MLEQHIGHVRTSIAAMTDDPANKERLFVTNEDILALPSVAGDNVFAVTAPQGTSLVVPDPDANLGPHGERHYQCAPCCVSLGFIPGVLTPASWCPAQTPTWARTVERHYQRPAC